MASKDQVAGLHYTHRLSYSARERVVGAFVLGGVLIVLALLAFGGRPGAWFEDWFTVQAVFRQAGGISPGTKVRVSGIEVGRVESFDLTDDNRIVVNLAILSRFRGLIRTDSRASLNLLSLVGLASVEISPGSNDQALVDEGAQLPVDEAPSIDAVIAGLTPALRRAEDTLERIDAVVRTVDPAQVQRAVDNLLAASEHLVQLTGQVAEGRGAVGRVLFDADLEHEITGSVSTLSRSLIATEARLQQLQTTFDAVERIGAQSQEAMAAMPRLLTEMGDLMGAIDAAVDPAHIQRISAGLAESSEHVASMTGQLAAGRGAAGTLLFDPQFEGRVRESMTSLARTLAATEQRLEELRPVFVAASDFSEQSSRTFEAVPGLIEESAMLVRQINETVAVMSDQLYQFPDLVLRTRVVLEEMERTLKAIQNTWPVSGSIAPSEPARLLAPRPSN